MVKIYTKKGDNGTSRTMKGELLSKDSSIFEALGDIDELSSCIGLAIEFMIERNPTCCIHVRESLTKIQSKLLDIGAELASDKFISNVSCTGLEKEIDEMTFELPELKNFILPGGGKASAMLHLSRTVCRRAERKIVSLGTCNTSIIAHVNNTSIIAYMNRLSDYLFTCARYVSHMHGYKDEIYKPCSSS